MPYVVWIHQGWAAHGSNKVTGYPASHGCLRLKTTHAKKLYELTNRVGTENVRFNVNLNYNCRGRTLAEEGIDQIADLIESIPDRIQFPSLPGRRNNGKRNSGTQLEDFQRR